MLRRQVRSNPDDTEARQRLEAELLRTTGEIWYVLRIDFDQPLTEMIEATGLTVQDPSFTRAESGEKLVGVKMVEATILTIGNPGPPQVSSVVSALQCRHELALRHLHPGRIEHLLAFATRERDYGGWLWALGSRYEMSVLEVPNYYYFPNLRRSDRPDGLNGLFMSRLDARSQRSVLSVRYV